MLHLVAIGLLVAFQSRTDLKTDFLVNGTLFLWHNVGSIPLSRIVSLELENDGLSRHITSIEQLENCVTIRSASEALSFARIYGSPITCQCGLDHRYLEVYYKKDLSLGYLFGSEEYLNYCKNAGPTELGLVDDRLMSLEHAIPATVTRSGDHWHVTRTVAYIEDGKWKLADTAENVWANGKYDAFLRNVRSPVSYDWTVFHSG